MKITWYGHSCFLIEAKEGRILTDPFDAKVPYDFPDSPVDIVTVSHDHFDHNAVDRVAGDPAVVKGQGKRSVAGIDFTGVGSYHDDRRGAERGENTIHAFDLEGIRIAHLGDLGTVLDDRQIAEIGDVRILLIPVGGRYTTDAAAAAAVSRSLEAVLTIIPMLFTSDRIPASPIETVER
ncbi:MBL fold metallo-hydrolase, partial [Candidatus Acetothermia bacterium]